MFSSKYGVIAKIYVLMVRLDLSPKFFFDPNNSSG